MTILGGLVADIRESKRLTQSELAEKSGLSKSIIAQIEQGKDPGTIKLSTLNSIACALDFPLEALAMAAIVDIKKC